MASADEGQLHGGLLRLDMFWSNYDMARYREMLRSRAFELLAEATLTNGYASEDRPPEVHPIIFARRPPP